MDKGVIGILLVIIVYLAGMLFVGFFYSRQNSDSGDFYLGGRKLGPFVTAMSAEASDMSSWLLMGLPGVAYLTGVCDALWTAIGLAIGTYLNWLLVAKRLRRYSERINAITLPDFFADRYRDTSGVIMGISSLFIIIFFVPYTASGFAACGKLFSTLFGLPYTTAMLLSAVVIVGYTALGGFLAASTTDLIQSIVMSIALVIVVLFGIQVAGGLDAVLAGAKELPGYLSVVNTYDNSTGTMSGYGMITIASSLAWGLGYFGMPHILLRFMATENEDNIGRSRRIASVWVVISMAIAIFIGIVGRAMSDVGAIGFLSGSDSETIIIRIAALLSENGVLAVIGAGVILAGILASTMSTADSQLLAASSAVSENILKGIFHVQLSAKMTIVIARATVVMIAVIGVFLAADPNSSVFMIVSFAWAGFGAVFGPVVLSALFWKRSNRQGVIAGMIGGGAMVFIWKYCVRPIGGIWNIYELLPAFLVATVLIIVVSLATAAPDKDIVDEFERR